MLLFHKYERKRSPKTTTNLVMVTQYDGLYYRAVTGVGHLLQRGDHTRSCCYLEEVKDEIEKSAFTSGI